MGARRKSEILKGSKEWLCIRTLIQPHVRTKMHAHTSLLHPAPTSLTTSSTPLKYRLTLDWDRVKATCSHFCGRTRAREMKVVSLHKR